MAIAEKIFVVELSQEEIEFVAGLLNDATDWIRDPIAGRIHEVLAEVHEQEDCFELNDDGRFVSGSQE